jgi:hypothetical protein
VISLPKVSATKIALGRILALKRVKDELAARAGLGATFFPEEVIVEALMLQGFPMPSCCRDG